MAKPKNKSHFIDTPAAIPIVIAQKYTVSSSGDRTGFLKRTIDRAPTIPSERAMFPEITFVIINVMIGSITRVEVCAVVVIHLCPTNCNIILINRENNISKIIISKKFSNEIVTTFTASNI